MKKAKIFGYAFLFVSTITFFLGWEFGFSNVMRIVLLVLGGMCVALLFIQTNSEIDEEFLAARKVEQIIVIVCSLLLIVDAVIRLSYGVMLL